MKGSNAFPYENQASWLIQGDIIPSFPDKNAIITALNADWPNATVPYVISGNYCNEIV